MVTPELRRRMQDYETLDTSSSSSSTTTTTTTSGVSAEKNRSFKIDFQSLFASDRDESPLELIVIPSTSTAGSGGTDKRRRRFPGKKKTPVAISSSFSPSVAVDSSGGDDDVVIVSAKLTVERKIVDQANNAFENEITYLHLHNKLKRKPIEQLPQSERARPVLCSEKVSSWKPNKLFDNIGRYMSRDRFQTRTTSTSSLPLQKERPTGSFPTKNASEALDLDASKNEKDLNQGQTVVMVDDEEPEHVEIKPEAEELPLRDASEALDLNALKNEKVLNQEQTVVLLDEEEPEHAEKEQEAEELPSSTYDGKIYYPTRDDPESMEILYSELKCLESGKCLTSTIMNFYIRFLQELPTRRSQANFCFFNTYFYSKLQEAVEYKKSDKEAFFIKFRRWWKGLNIFQKAYIFLPINEDNHWSLVIICIPDKEDESGPIILHLDSLGLHSSMSIFDNIKGLLKCEWQYLNQDGAVLDIPISERIWKHLPDRIDEEKIMAPRQTNHYDCGLFVLYYMERFIQEAPDRLQKQHLTMFGKNWFKPEEASSLRLRIKNILQEEFQKALREDVSLLVSLFSQSDSANTS